MDENKILESLAKVPELVNASEQLISNNEKMFSVLAKRVQERVKAYISKEEIANAASEITTAIKATPCAPPNPADVADQVVKEINNDLKSIIEATVREAVKETKVKAEVTHLYAPDWNISKYADKKYKELVRALSVVCVFLMTVSGIFASMYYSSEEYLGSQYVKICCSKFITPEEKEMLVKDVYSTGVLPKNFDKNILKQKIKRNKAILDQRERESKQNKGKFTTATQLER